MVYPVFGHSHIINYVFTQLSTNRQIVNHLPSFTQVIGQSLQHHPTSQSPWVSTIFNLYLELKKSGFHVSSMVEHSWPPQYSHQNSCEGWPAIAIFASCEMMAVKQVGSKWCAILRCSTARAFLYSFITPKALTGEQTMNIRAQHQCLKLPGHQHS